MTFHCPGLPVPALSSVGPFWLVILVSSWLKMLCLAKASVSKHLTKKNHPVFKGAWICFSVRPITRPRLPHYIHVGVIVHLVMEAKFIFFITWLEFLNWLGCQKEYFFLSLFSPFTGNRNIIKSRWKRNPFPETNKNQLWLILREAFRGDSQENAGGFCPYLSFLPAFEDHMFTAWFALLRAHRNFYQFMWMCWNVRSLIRGGPFLARTVPCAVCILATSQSRGQLLDTN